MIYHNSKPSENPCQLFFNNQLKFNPEDRFLADCGIYCTTIIEQPDSPWQNHANLMGYWYSKKQTKISKLQKNLLHYLHRWYFSKGKPAYLKSTNLAKKFKSSRRNTIRAITRLVERGILIRIEYWSNKYQRFRSVLLPNLHKTIKEKLIFQLNKRTHPLKVTDTGGSVRYIFNILKSLHIQKCSIYINILYTNYLSNNYLSQKLTIVNLAAPAQKQEQHNHADTDFVPINPLLSNMKGTTNMQTKLKSKPKRITLKVQNEIMCPSSIEETINILKKKDFNPKCIPQVALSDLLYYIENKIFKNYGDNNPEIQAPDLNSFFRIRMFEQSKFVEQYDTKLFKMILKLFIDNKDFHNSDMTLFSKKIIGYWSACARNNKNKNTKFTNHNPNLKTKTGFKIYIGILYHLYYTCDYGKTSFPLSAYEDKFKVAIKRFFNYAYVLNLPKKVSFDIALVDHNDSNRFLNCITMLDDEFYNFTNSSKKVYQIKPESKKSLDNFKQIFVDSFYSTKLSEGNKRFEQFKPKFSRFLEILITRIEKYNNNGKHVELCGLKLTAETEQDAPVLYYYMEWLRTNLFSEITLRFDEMFSLENWNKFIKNFMRNERGYSDYWKIVDTN